MRNNRQKVLGRPKKDPEQLKQRELRIRLIPEDDDFLKDVARATGASKPQVVEQAIRRLRQGDEQVLEFLYGAKIATAIMLVARVMHSAGTAAVYLKTGSFRGQDDWMSDPYTYDQGIWAAAVALEGLRPEGDPAFQREIPGPWGTAMRPEVLGPDMAAGTLYALANPDLPGASDSAETFETRAYAARVLAKLGDVRITVPPPIDRQEGHRRVAELRARRARRMPQDDS